MSSLEYAKGRQHQLRMRQNLYSLFLALVFFLGDVNGYIYIYCNVLHTYKPTIGLTPKMGSRPNQS